MTRFSGGPVGLRARADAVARRRPGLLPACGCGAVAAVGLVFAGPVAALIGAVYAALAVRAVLRRQRRRSAAVDRARSLDDLCALAADLRAGLPPAVAAGRAAGSPSASTEAVPWSGTGSHPDRHIDDRLGVARGLEERVGGGRGVDGRVGAGGGVARRIGGEQRVPGRGGRDRRITELSDAVWRLAERTGAPAADLVERIEADARAADRAMASAAAQSAGAQATALLLAALPLGGIGLGYGIGVDPLAVLLHTGLGAGCALGAVLLQGAGLLWADRLASGPGR